MKWSFCSIKQNSYRMSTYLNHNQKSALKLYHYRNPNFAFDVATNQIPIVQFLFDSDWWMLNSSHGYYKREEVHLVVTNIFNKLCKNIPRKNFFDRLLWFLEPLKIDGLNESNPLFICRLCFWSKISSHDNIGWYYFMGQLI